MKRLRLLLPVFALTIFLLNLPSSAFGHGEDKPGPHGGVISMPGPFHTEVLADGDRTVKVYLLDLFFKNPTIGNSSIRVTIEQNQATQALNCTPKEDHFVCTFNDYKPLGSGTLIVDATRDGTKGVPARCPLPVRPPENETRKNLPDHN